MANFEYQDVDSTTDKNFMFFLANRAINLDYLEVNYIDNLELHQGPEDIPGNKIISLNNFSTMYQAHMNDISPTRLTDEETRRFYQFMKYERTSNYDNLTRESLSNIDYGRNDQRRSIIHWRLFLDDFEDCNFQYLLNGAINLDGLILVNFPCPYEDPDPGIDTAQDDYHTFLTDYVNEVDKKNKERVWFKNFIKDFTVNNNKQQCHNEFFADLETNSGTVHDHNKNNVISRLVNTKRYKRRVLAKLPPFA